MCCSFSRLCVHSTVITTASQCAEPNLGWDFYLIPLQHSHTLYALSFENIFSIGIRAHTHYYQSVSSLKKRGTALHSSFFFAIMRQTRVHEISSFCEDVQQNNINWYKCIPAYFLITHSLKAIILSNNKNHSAACVDHHQKIDHRKNR